MYTSIVSCNVKGHKFSSASWSNVEDIVTAQPTCSATPTDGGAEQLHPVGSQVGFQDGSGLEPLIDATQLVIERCTEVSEVMIPYCGKTIGESSRLFKISVDGSPSYFASLTQPSRENCFDVERKYRLSVVDYSGLVVLQLEKVYDACLDATSNCWVCCCCWCGVIGGTMIVKTAFNGLVIGQVHHRWGLYRPRYDIQDADGYQLMVITGDEGCGDCLPQCRQNMGMTFEVRSAENQLHGSISKPMDDAGSSTSTSTLRVTFTRSLSLKWKALLLSTGFMLDMLYYGGSRKRSQPPSSSSNS